MADEATEVTVRQVEGRWVAECECCGRVPLSAPKPPGSRPRLTREQRRVLANLPRHPRWSSARRSRAVDAAGRHGAAQHPQGWTVR